MPPMSSTFRPRSLAVALAPLPAALVLSAAAPASVTAGAREELLASQLMRQINAARVIRALPVLQLDTTLATVARWRSGDMATRGYFSHAIPPTGRRVFSELDRRGYCYTLAGENIGWSTYPDETATAQIQQMFMASPTHRANILNGRWTNMGIGAYQAADGKKIWTVLFSKPCTSTSSTTKPKATPRPRSRINACSPTPEPTTSPPTPTRRSNACKNWRKACASIRVCTNSRC